MKRLRARAPGKVNLCLLVGAVRDDGRHELVTVLESVSLYDELELTVLGDNAGADEIVCPGVEGPNLVTAALEGLRARGWDGPRVRIEIVKRIPVAGGMAGGSSDAAAALRLAEAVHPVTDEVIAVVAAELGSDVPSQLVPGAWIATGAGESVEAAERLESHAFVIVPQSFELSTADVYREADRLGDQRSDAELSSSLEAVRTVLSLPGGRIPAELAVNDLEPAALSLRPEIASCLGQGSGCRRRKRVRVWIGSHRRRPAVGRKCVASSGCGGRRALRPLPWRVRRSCRRRGVWPAIPELGHNSLNTRE